MWTLLFLLLPVAAWSGWWIGRRGQKTVAPEEHGFVSEYYDSINYLINEQTDKAMESFSKTLNVDASTIEGQLMLGNIFRRKGEVEKAIRIHQEILAKPNLSSKQRNQALLALGQDYLNAGVYDRAENVFAQIAKDKTSYGEKARYLLLSIYEIEKEWDACIEVAESIQAKTMAYLGVQIAQYYCEKAKEAQRSGDLGAALKYIKKANQHDRYCTRASIAQGDIEFASSRYKQALKSYKKAIQQNQIFIPEIIDRIVKCHEKIGSMAALDHYLTQMLNHHQDISLALAYANRLYQSGRLGEAISFITNFLRRYPSIVGLNHLVAFQLFDGNKQNQSELASLQALIGKLIAVDPLYQCHSCGFSAKTLHWHCPGCKHWCTVQPITHGELETVSSKS